MPPKLRPPNRGRRSFPVTLDAPTGGLNGRDSYADMPPSDAFQLDNWVPRGTSVDTRNGCTNHVTAIPAAVESLEAYTGVGAKMLAFAGGSIYDVTLAGEVGDALMSDRVSNLVTTAMFSNSGSQFLLIYSGADQPLSYDGTTLTGLTITGLTGDQETLHSPLAFKGRIFLAQANELGFYYLGIGAIQGAASYFDLQQQCLKGGSLATIASYSQESGNGPADYAVFATTEGEYLMYAGTDPSNANTWELVGRYYGPAPIGKKSWFKFRSDVYFITREGILSLSQIRQMGEENATTEYLTSKLGKFYTDTTRYAGTPGWAGFVYSRGQMLVVNVPRTGSVAGRFTQFIMNTNNNAWAQITGWNALCWEVFGERAYYGTYDGRIVLADEGTYDIEEEIQCVARQAWNTFDDENGMGAAEKHFHNIAFALLADGRPSIACALNVNFENVKPVYASPITPAEGAEWDTTFWDTSLWSGAAVVQTIGVPVERLGYIASPWVQAVSPAGPIQWFASRIILEKTQGVLFQ